MKNNSPAFQASEKWEKDWGESNGGGFCGGVDGGYLGEKCPVCPPVTGPIKLSLLMHFLFCISHTTHHISSCYHVFGYLIIHFLYIMIFNNGFQISYFIHFTHIHFTLCQSRWHWTLWGAIKKFWDCNGCKWTVMCMQQKQEVTFVSQYATWHRDLCYTCFCDNTLEANIKFWVEFILQEGLFLARGGQLLKLYFNSPL